LAVDTLKARRYDRKKKVSAKMNEYECGETLRMSVLPYWGLNGFYGSENVICCQLSVNQSKNKLITQGGVFQYYTR